jgi:hypothetical protein
MESLVANTVRHRLTKFPLEILVLAKDKPVGPHLASHRDFTPFPKYDATLSPSAARITFEFDTVSLHYAGVYNKNAYWSWRVLFINSQYTLLRLVILLGWHHTRVKPALLHFESSMQLFQTTIRKASRTWRTTSSGKNRRLIFSIGSGEKNNITFDDDGEYFTESNNDNDSIRDGDGPCTCFNLLGIQMPLLDASNTRHYEIGDNDLRRIKSQLQKTVHLLYSFRSRCILGHTGHTWLFQRNFLWLIYATGNTSCLFTAIYS